MAWMRGSVRVRRSRNARDAPCPRARSRSPRFVSTSATVFSSSPRAISCRASFLTLVGVRARTDAAARAARALDSTNA